MRTADDVLHFWFTEHGSEDWFAANPEFDAVLADNFADTHEAVARGEAWTWRDGAHGRLAEILVLDQFSRQLYRGSAHAFSQDAMALALSQELVAAELDAHLSETERMFAYMPYMHSESLVVHEEALRLFTGLGNDEVLDFEKKHRDTLVRFGRYPKRNAALGRDSTPEEIAYLKENEGRMF